MAERWAMTMSVIVVVAAVISVLVLDRDDHLGSSDQSAYTGFPLVGYHLAVRTDRQVYNLGEAVQYTITNTGTKTARFTDSGYDLDIEDLSGNIIVSYRSPVPARASLDPGNQVHRIWDQTDSDGKLVSPGTYVATTQGRESDPFTIIHDESAYPWLVFEEGRHLRVIPDKREYQMGEHVIYSIINTGTENMIPGGIPYTMYVKNHLGEIVYELSNNHPPSRQYQLEPSNLLSYVWHQNIHGDPDELSYCTYRDCWEVAPRGPYMEDIAKLDGQQVPAGTYVIVVFGWWESPPFTIK